MSLATNTRDVSRIFQLHYLLLANILDAGCYLWVEIIGPNTLGPTCDLTSSDNIGTDTKLEKPKTPGTPDNFEVPMQSQAMSETKRDDNI